MLSFEPQKYSSTVAELVDIEHLPPLGPGRPRQAFGPALAQLTAESLFAPHAVADAQMAACCLSAIWLWHNYLDESHTISQNISSASGSYWHGIMHRREPDYSNSKYWYRRVGDHPIFDDLRDQARELTARSPLSDATACLQDQPVWDPYAFVDLCQAAARGGSGDAQQLCREIGRIEWMLLFDYCFQHALGRRVTRP